MRDLRKIEKRAFVLHYPPTAIATKEIVCTNLLPACSVAEISAAVRVSECLSRMRVGSSLERTRSYEATVEKLRKKVCGAVFGPGNQSQ